MCNHTISDYIIPIYILSAFRSIFLLSGQKGRKNIKIKFIKVARFPLAIVLFNSG